MNREGTQNSAAAIDALDYTPTMPAAVDWLCQTYAESPMILERDASATYAQLAEKSAHLAKALLANGVGKGTRVALLFPNGVDFVATFLAITRIGALAVPVNTFCKTRELIWQLRHSDAQMLITVDQFLQNDYVERLDEGIADWSINRTDELFAAEVPYLRRILVRSTEHWPGYINDLEEFMNSGAGISDAHLAAIEASVAPSDLLVVLYTSGSSADPKGVVHTHNTVLRRATSLGNLTGIGPGEVVFSPSPYFWTGGFVNGLMVTFLKGGALITQPRFEAGPTLEQFEKHKVTIATGWPHFADSMKEHPDFAKRDLSSLRDGNLTPLLLGLEGSDDPGLIATGIGMTESCAQHTYGQVEFLPESLRGAYGTPAPGVEQIIVDVDTGEELPEGQEGELCIRGYSVMQGYYKNVREEAFRPDGYFPTGDLGIIKGGYYFFRGRKGDMVKTSGANVSPEEVRNAALAVDGIAECFVSRLPDPKKGQIVGAAIVLNPGISMDEELLRQELRKTLSSFKVPKAFVFLQAGNVPMLATAKVDRRALLDMLLAQVTS